MARAADILTLRREDVAKDVASRSLTLLLAAACGLIAANVYYAQPLAGEIGRAIGLSPEASGLVVTLTQVGYGAGLLFDRSSRRPDRKSPAGHEHGRRYLHRARRCRVVEQRGVVPALCPAGRGGRGRRANSHSLRFSPRAPGNTRNPGRQCDQRPHGRRHAVAPGFELDRVLVELESRLSHIGRRHVRLGGRVGCATAPADAGVEIDISCAPGLDGELALNSRVLRQRVIYQCFLYGAFSLFWTTIPLRLTGPAFHFSQGGVALFALLGGGGGILAAPIGGRLADRGWTHWATAGAMIAVAIGFLLTLVPIESSTRAFCLLVVAAIVLDSGMTVNFILGQRSIFVTEAEYRSRLNGLYMAFFFLAGAAGSALGGWAYATGGWRCVSYLGVGLPVAGLLCWLGETQRLHGGGDGGSGNHDETRTSQVVIPDAAGCV